jgi:hypothetical protein
MAARSCRTPLGVLEVFREGLTKPGFKRMTVVFVGWVLTSGTHAVTEALVATGVAGRQHHEAFHRFFSRGSWNPDELGQLLFGWIRQWQGEASPIRVAVDDTLAPKKGPHVFGLGSHLDAVRSTRRQLIFCFGHCWVVLALLVRVPFSERTWAMPILFRLYRNKKECEAKGGTYRKKTELARELLDVFISWCGKQRVEVSADSAYCNDTVTRGLPAQLVLFGAMRPDAVLTDPPPDRQPGRCGRPRKRGRVLLKPQALARDGRTAWQSCTADLYGQNRRVEYKECLAQWYRACGTQLLRVILVRVDHGALTLRVFFSTDPTLSVPQILEGYARRWSIEVSFRDLKQLLGFADSSARKRQAVERTAPFVGLSYSVLILWFAQGAWRSSWAVPPLRPWYPHKRGHSFADVLRAAQRAFVHTTVLDLDSEFDNLHKLRRPLLHRRLQRKRAA